MQKQPDKLAVYSLREIYHQLGEYEFKIVLNSRFFKSGHGSVVRMFDSDGKEMPIEQSTWGKKINVQFKIDEGVPDGVARIKLHLVPDKGPSFEKHLSYWTIKP